MIPRDFHRSISLLLSKGLKKIKIRQSHVISSKQKKQARNPNSTACLNPTCWVHLWKNKYKSIDL